MRTLKELSDIAGIIASPDTDPGMAEFHLQTARKELGMPRSDLSDSQKKEVSAALDYAAQMAVSHFTHKCLSK